MEAIKKPLQAVLAQLDGEAQVGPAHGVVGVGGCERGGRSQP